MKKTDEFLPIGTVVILENGEKRLMITGFCPIEKETKEMYDYFGCLYPEGIISSSRSYLFNKEQIKEIFYLGYSDKEEKHFKNQLNALLKSEINN